MLGFFLLYREGILVKKISAEERSKKINLILNTRIPGESYITTSPRVWKKFVLYHFNQIARGELTADELLNKMEASGIVFNQSKKLVIYPVIECLERISRIAKVPDNTLNMRGNYDKKK